MRIELQVAVDDPLGDAVLVELGEALNGFHVHASHINQLLTDLLELLVLGFDEREQGRASLLHERAFIEGDLTDLVEGLTVAEDDVELARLILSGGVGLRDGSDEGLPGGGLGRLAPAFERFGDAGDDLGLTIRHPRRIRQEFVQGVGLLISAFRDAAGDELGDLLDPADVRAGDEVGGRELTDAGPDEQRQVMIRAILLVAEEMLGNERTHLDGEVRERGGDRQTHALAARLAGQLQDRGFAGF
ncbi:MAG: hypothetical protein EBR95_07595, partial [Verrucomicrobia bacterium]|nr:hypothetical protein [Verrucomicrobiota bacterium]